MSEPLAALPGADDDAGTGPAARSLFERLLEDDGAVRAEPVPVAQALARYRDAARSWHRDVVGAVHVPAGAIDGLLDALETGDRAVPVVLASDGSGLDGLRQARNMVLEDDRVELVAVHVGLPEEMSPPAGTRAVLEALDFTAPARLDTALRPGWGDAVTVVAADGAEHVALTLTGADAATLGAFVRATVDHDLVVHCSGGPDHAVTTEAHGRLDVGLLNVVGALRAALNGAEAEAVAEVLGHTTAAPLAAALRRMSDADCAVLRSFLGSVACADPASVVDDLVALGLLDPHDEG